MTIEQISKDFGVHPMTLQKWMRRADIDEGAKPGQTRIESAELRRRGSGSGCSSRRTRCFGGPRRICRRRTCREKVLPARDGARRSRVPVTVTCRVLKLSRQTYYRWLAVPVTPSEVVEAYRANALLDAHRDDPEFGHRLLADEAAEAGEAMADRTAWRIASANGWFSAFGKPTRGKGRRPGPPVHDDLCAIIDEGGRTRHVFAAEAANELWLTDITEHKTAWIPSRGRQALPLRDQGHVLRSDRGVFHRLADEVETGRASPRERCRDARRRRRLRGA